jgi:hypothetical protein
MRKLLPLLFATVMTAPAVAETVRIPLPDLLGRHTLDDLGFQSFERPEFSTEIDRALLPSGALSYRLEWSGTLTAGRVIGDGTIRESVERLLQGSFIPNLTGSGESFARFPTPLTAFGSFKETWQLERLPGQFIDWIDVGSPPPSNHLSISLNFVPDYLTLGDSIPFFLPPVNGEGRYASDGLILLEPIQAEIASAELVIEAIPEPATFGIAVLAISLSTAIAVFRSRRSYRSKVPD